MDDSSPHELLDQMNLTGQSQPSLPSLPPDPMLDNQILNDILLDPEMYPLTPLIENSPSDDGISSALVDNIIEDFDSSLLTGINMPDSVPEILSTPQHSTIEETMEGIHLSQSQTDYSSVSSAILTGSSPVEHTIIDNSILSNRHINQPKRLNKSAAKRHRHTDYQRPSTTVAPFNDSSSSSSCQASATVQMQSESLWSSQNEQWDSTDSLKIKIAAQPRARFRPRTENESRNASHFIRCDTSSSYDYPTIIIPRRWSLESHENLIEVTLVKQDHQPHRYTISNKNAKNEYQSDALIFRNNDDHTLFYRVTDSDFTQGYKSFQIEFVKSKQGGEITKELIRNEQLEHSKLRFTRIYLDKQNNYQRDEASTEYSSLMSEAYGDVAVEHFGPRYGSKVGEMVYVLMKGHVAKNDVIIEVSESVSGMYERPSFNKTGNMIFFTMPNATMIMGDEVTAEVKIYYKTEPLYETSYIYAGAVDDLLNRLHISDANRADGNGSFGNVYHGTNFFAATGALPTSTRSNTSRTVKRLQKKK